MLITSQRSETGKSVNFGGTYGKGRVVISQ